MKWIVALGTMLALMACSESTNANDEPANENKTTITLVKPGEESFSVLNAQVMVVKAKADFFIQKGLLEREMFNPVLFTGNVDVAGDVVINNIEAFPSLLGEHDLYVYVSTDNLNNWDSPTKFTYNSNNHADNIVFVSVENTILKSLIDGAHFTIRTTTVDGSPVTLESCGLDDQVTFSIMEPFLEFTMNVITNGTVCEGADLQANVSINAELGNYRNGVDDDGINFINPAAQAAYFGTNPQFFSYDADTIRITRSLPNSTIVDTYVVD